MPVPINATEGDTVTFVCDPDGDPTANVTWLKDAALLDGTAIWLDLLRLCLCRAVGDVRPSKTRLLDTMTILFWEK